MNPVENNEITVRIKGELKEFCKIVEEKGFTIANEFTMNDTYFVPETLDLNQMTIREILSKAVLVRDIVGKTSNTKTKLLTFKVKNFDGVGNILDQESINCNIADTQEATRFIKAIGYKEIMNIKEDDVVYKKDDLEFAVKIIENGDNLIEIETEDNENLNTTEKLIKKVNEIGIPIYTDNYFVKKAENQLEKILKKKKRCKWCNLKNSKYIDYHDNEWCKTNFDDKYLYEMLILESFQAGLSWECVLNKRDSLRKAYDNFELDKVCSYDDKKINELLENKDIIRNKLKVKASIENSKIFKSIVNEYGTFYNYLKTFTGDETIYEIDKTTNELSDSLSKDLQKRGMKFVGSTIIYSYLQAIGIIYSHDKECYLYKTK